MSKVREKIKLTSYDELLKVETTDGLKEIDVDKLHDFSNHPFKVSDDEKMEELIELLEEIQPDADFENCDTLIDDGILDSFAILSIVSELQDTYDITITPADIIPENFNSAKALWDMVCRLKD